MKWCRDQGIDRGLYDCVVNKTSISFRTNRSIGGSAPSVYLTKLTTSISPDALDTALRTHAISPTHLRANDFGGFFRERETALIDRIETAMGKRVILDAESHDEPPSVDSSDDSEEDFDEENAV